MEYSADGPRCIPPRIKRCSRYTTPNIPWPWSCDWEMWSGTDLWISDDGKSRGIEEELNGPFRLAPPIEPLIFYDPDGDRRIDFDFLFAFTCGGEYYRDGEGRGAVRRYHDRFATEFLCARFASFGVPERDSTQYLELVRQSSRWHHTDFTLSPTDEHEAQWARWEEQMKSAWRNPPPNDLYTEIFREEEKYEIMVCDS
ncbi:hypothetical protein DFH07DRAFT_1056479 [Mycena maculata]|uniref:Uncharacterized protein n=1 Tax=Mycena maculata TaxID=230809 RepID=A0AAD7K3M5_9AGAR|nr:hypothetical protein DFH07DRAFT_1056479 [Mycena maculata]